MALRRFSSIAAFVNSADVWVPLQWWTKNRFRLSDKRTWSFSLRPRRSRGSDFKLISLGENQIKIWRSNFGPQLKLLWTENFGQCNSCCGQKFWLVFESHKMSIAFLQIPKHIYTKLTKGHHEIIKNNRLCNMAAALHKDM